MLSYEGEEAGWAVTSLGGRCIIGSRQASVAFAGGPGEVADGATEPRANARGQGQAVVENGQRHRLTQEVPCFWFPDTPYTFRLRWPDDGHGAPTPPPGLQGPSDEGHGGSAKQGKKGGEEAKR